jgi:hypothetical protein
MKTRKEKKITGKNPEEDWIPRWWLEGGSRK